MLVLSRKLNEKIVIDGGIVVTVVKIDRNQIRLGIEAPPHVRVFREEIAGSHCAEPPRARRWRRGSEFAPERAADQEQPWCELRKVEEKIDNDWLTARQPVRGRLVW